MTNNDNENYALIYIQKQEQFILEIVRKSINLEVQIISLTNKINEFEKLYSESQNSVSQQNEMMEQAANSIKELTVKSEKYEKLKSDYSNINNERDKILSANHILNKKINELMHEINRQNDEMKKLYDENEELKNKIPKKKTRKKSEIKLLEENNLEDDNTF